MKKLLLLNIIFLILFSLISCSLFFSADHYLTIKSITANGIENYYGNIKFQKIILEFIILDNSIEIKEITLYRKNTSYPFDWLEIAKFNNLIYVDDVGYVSPTFNPSYTEAWYEYTFDLTYIKNNTENKLESSTSEHIVVMDDIVFWTEYGNRYHKNGCYTISSSYKYFSTREFAYSYHGLTQCQICKP